MNRDLYALTTETRELALKFLMRAGEEELETLIYCTHRPLESQAKRYRQGRAIGTIRAKADQLDKLYKSPDLAAILMGVGPQLETIIVTYAGPGQSLHNYGMAFDGVPVLNDQLIWDSSKPIWQLYGRLIVESGLRWYGESGTWDLTHSQLRGVSWRDLIKTYDFKAL